VTVSWCLLLSIGIIAVTIEQFIHLTKPKILSKKARPPLKEAQLVIYKESSELILNAIRNTDEAQVVRNFNEIYMFPQIPGYYPGRTAGIMSSLFAAIGAERLAQSSGSTGLDRKSAFVKC
jgi:hypothetical protein